MRKENWPERLSDYLAKPHTFDWMTCNCALFAADGVLAQTGKDFAASYRGPKTKRGMVSKLRKVCGGNVEDAVTRELGEPIQISMAGRGDVVSFDFGEGPALGLCSGATSFFITEDCPDKVAVSTLKCRSAWRVL